MSMWKLAPARAAGSVLVVGIVMAWLTGCAVLREDPASPDAPVPEVETPEVEPEPTPEDRWTARQERLACMNRWKLEGRMALATDDDGWNANLRWEQDDQRFRMRLSGPFGSGAFRLAGDEGRFRIEHQGETRFYLSSPEDVLERELGASIPVSGLRYWVLGGVQPQREADYELDDAGRLTRLEQSGWSIRYRSYRDYNGEQLPRHVNAERPGIRVRLVADEWTLDETQDCPA